MELNYNLKDFSLFPKTFHSKNSRIEYIFLDHARARITIDQVKRKKHNKHIQDRTSSSTPPKPSKLFNITESH